MNQPKKCVQCGSEELYQGEGNFIGPARSVFHNLNGRPRLGILPSTNVNNYICGQCGYVMFFLKEEELNEVRSKWKRVDALD